VSTVSEVLKKQTNGHPRALVDASVAPYARAGMTVIGEGFKQLLIECGDGVPSPVHPRIEVLNGHQVVSDSPIRVPDLFQGASELVDMRPQRHRLQSGQSVRRFEVDLQHRGLRWRRTETIPVHRQRRLRVMGSCPQ
jgi:hypothetical protein